MTYTELPPPSDLASWVQSFWVFTAPEDLPGTYMHRVMPDGCVSIIHMASSFIPGGSMLLISGPTMTSHDVPVHAGNAFYGVRLQPGVIRSLIGADLPDLPGLRGPLAALSPRHAASLRDHFTTNVNAQNAFSNAVREWIPRADPLDSRLTASVRLFRDGTARTADVADRVAMSERQFQRLFRYHVGLTPKQYARIRRFRTALGNILRAEPDTWGRVAADCGFSDQAHMTREITSFFGAPPETLRAQVGVIEHINVNP